MKTIPLIIALNLVLFLAGPLLAQANEVQSGYPTYSLDELEVELYTPTHVHVNDLYGTIRSTYGREFLVSENGSTQDAPRNVQMLGDSLLIYDTSEYRARVLAAAAKLDVPGAAGSRQSASLPDESALALFEYTPRFLNVEAVFEALLPFAGMVKVANPDGGWKEISTVSVSHQSNLVIVREMPERVMQMKALLERIDQPKPHVTISCTVLRATRDQGDTDLPVELVENLSALVPYTQFDLVTMGLITTSVTPQAKLELRMPLADNSTAEALMIPEAYDAATGSLTLRDFRFQLPHTVEFSTRVTVHSDEYVVIGASGPVPVFVVLRLQTVSS